MTSSFSKLSTEYRVAAEPEWAGGGLCSQCSVAWNCLELPVMCMFLFEDPLEWPLTAHFMPCLNLVHGHIKVLLCGAFSVLSFLCPDIPVRHQCGYP